MEQSQYSLGDDVLLNIGRASTNYRCAPTQAFFFAIGHAQIACWEPGAKQP